MTDRWQLYFDRQGAFDVGRYHCAFELTYSGGVLKRFDRDVTVRLLQEQARCARRVLVQISTKYTAYIGEITDERIYRIRELRSIVTDAGLSVVASFGYGDVTATPAQIWARRILPCAAWRWLQKQGLAYSIGVIGERAGA